MTGSNWFGYGPQSRDIRAFEVIFTSHYLVKAEKRRRRSKLKLLSPLFCKRKREGKYFESFYLTESLSR